jgi:hypothetical protein
LSDVALQLLRERDVRGDGAMLPDGVRAGGVRGRIADDVDVRERQLRADDDLVQRLRVRLGHELVQGGVHRRH